MNAEFDFYTTDTSRAWVMEGADPALYKLKDRLYEAQRRMIAAAKPGLPICDLYHIAYDYVKEMYPSYRRGHQGHSISMGPATAEAPYINPTTTRPLEAGMVLAMEVPCYIGGVRASTSRTWCCHPGGLRGAHPKHPPLPVIFSLFPFPNPIPPDPNHF